MTPCGAEAGLGPHHCEDMELHLRSPEIPLEYDDRFREYAILVRGGRALHLIEYCPWCGTKLPESLRDTWFEKLDALGLEPESPDIPAAMRTGEWWRGGPH